MFGFLIPIPNRSRNISKLMSGRKRRDKEVAIFIFCESRYLHFEMKAQCAEFPLFSMTFYYLHDCLEDDIDRRGVVLLFASCLTAKTKSTSVFSGCFLEFEIGWPHNFSRGTRTKCWLVVAEIILNDVICPSFPNVNWLSPITLCAREHFPILF